MLTTNGGLGKTIGDHITSRTPNHLAETTMTKVLTKTLKMKIDIRLGVSFVVKIDSGII